MPFVPQNSRKRMAEGGQPETVGDLCYLEYKQLIEAWKSERRWTTAHKEFQRLFGGTDEEAAKHLAYMVWFMEHVMLYESEKQFENGDIE